MLIEAESSRLPQPLFSQAQLNSLKPLKVPHQLLAKKSSDSLQSHTEEGAETGSKSGNQTDNEKNVHKRTAALIDVNDYYNSSFNITI